MHSLNCPAFESSRVGFHYNSVPKGFEPSLNRDWFPESLFEPCSVQVLPTVPEDGEELGFPRMKGTMRKFVGNVPSVENRTATSYLSTIIGVNLSA